MQRNAESRALLQTLAKPIARPGPQIAAQKDVVTRILAQPLPPYADILNLGGVVLTEMAADDDTLMRDAQERGLVKDLKPWGGIVGKTFWREGVEDKGISDLLIRNTLATMIDAQQIKYLRAAGLPNADFVIVVEIHLYLARSMDQWGFHKDTKGQTLFVNLNYHLNQEVAGPETLVNPPSTPAHDRALGIEDGEATDRGTLPPTFLTDLMAARGELPEGSEIGTSSVPAYGYVAFVDEAVHHATPRYGHRTVQPKHFKDYLRTTHPAEFAAAQQGYDEYAKSFTGTRIWGFGSYLEKNSPIAATDAKKWGEWMKLANATSAIARPALLASGMTGAEVDVMLDGVGRQQRAATTGRPDAETAFFVDAAVPMPGLQEAVRSPLKRDDRPPLTRQMSQKALAKTLPPPAEKERRFFRTWVRAVRRPARR